MSDVFNPRAVAGDNVAVDYAKQVTDRLAKDYEALTTSVADMLDEARALPATVDDEATASIFTEVIARARALKKRVDGIREAEKEPHLTSERAIDQFFFTLEEKLERRKKTDRVGMVDVLHQRVHAYNQRRLDEERRKREEERRIAQEAEDEARRKREAADKIAREAAEKAARARKQESIDAANRAAAEAAATAAAAAAEEQTARDQRRDAATAAGAKAADLVRERHDSGALNTMRQVPYVEITDSMALDAAALWPFVKDDHKLMALRAWAKITQYRRPMSGAIIEMRDETVVR